jgi:adenosine deaminase
MNASRAVSSILVAASIFATGWYIRNLRKTTPASSRVTSPKLSPRGAHSNSVVELSDEDLRKMIRRKVKVELHCHLNGSVRSSTLCELLGGSDEDASDGVVHTIEDAFREFKRVYKAVNSEAALRRVVRETLEDSLNDNIRYLELRTTPRKLTDIQSRKDYVRVVVDEIKRFEHLNTQSPLREFPENTIAVRLILTVDRTQPISAGEQTVDIALRFRDIVVGLDFAGNPTIGSFADFVPVFARARGHGLFTTVHTSEIRGAENETTAILEFKPNRVGHFLFPTEAQIQLLRDNSIGIEACPTSNICAISGKSPLDGNIDRHHIIERFIRDTHGMLSINTDDPGVFGKTLSDELISVAKSFKLKKHQIDNMLTASAKQAFISAPEKESLATAILES